MSSSLINAKTAGELIAGYVEKSWPNDREEIFRILDLVQEVIWESGFFEGSTKWATVKVNPDKTIVTPRGYQILVGAKYGCSKMDIKDVYFTLHENGPLTEPEESESFSRNIQFLGSYPTLINHIEDSKICKGGYRLGVISKCLPPSSTPPLTVVSAHDKQGKRIYTYRFDQSEEPEFVDEGDFGGHGPNEVSLQEGILEGVVYPVTNKLIKYSNVIVSDIYNIQKDPSLSRVDYYLFDEADDGCKSRGILIASLDPFETVSKYNIYKIVDRCITKDRMYGLFKRNKPETLVNDSQLILTDNKRGLIALAKGVQYKYSKDDHSQGNAFLADGLDAISKELIANNPAFNQTLQIRNIRDTSSKRRFR